MTVTFNAQILIEKLLKTKPSLNNSRKLVVIFGVLGDFDSIEYGQILAKNFDYLKQNDINLIAFGIGNKASKKKFCTYTGFPLDNLEVLDDNKLHEKLNCYPGKNIKLGQLINLLIMCTGIGSPGTLKEVMRGYLGDHKSSQIFSNKDKIKFNLLPAIPASIFNFAGQDGFLRPFELATLRLVNMFEVLGNWSTYMPNNLFLTQRGATFIIDENNHITYSYFSNALLSYSSNMSKPLSFINIL